MSFSPAKDANGSGNREAKGFLVLIIALCLPFVLQYTYRYLFEKGSMPVPEVQYLQEQCAPVKQRYPVTEKSNRVLSSVKRKEVKAVDINLADSSELEKLPGIGFKLASRIIKYRMLLGGYIKIEQVKEVYGITEETYEKIKPFCTVSLSEVKHIQGDSLWYKPYSMYHPYLTKDLKSHIVKANKTSTYDTKALKEMVRVSNEKLLWYLNL